MKQRDRTEIIFCFCHYELALALNAAAMTIVLSEKATKSNSYSPMCLYLRHAALVIAQVRRSSECNCLNFEHLTKFAT